MRRADNVTTFMCRLSWNLGASASWNPQCMPRLVMGLLYFLLDQVGMTERKLAFVKLSNCCCHGVKSYQYSTDTESDLCPLTLIGFCPSLNTENDFQVYEQFLAVASRILASNSQMHWSPTKSRKSRWPCDSCSTSTCSALRLSAISQNYSGSSWPIRLLLGCGDEFKSPCSRILLERLWVWIST